MRLLFEQILLNKRLTSDIYSQKIKILDLNYKKSGAMVTLTLDKSSSGAA